MFRLCNAFSGLKILSHFKTLGLLLFLDLLTEFPVDEVAVLLLLLLNLVLKPLGQT